MKTIHAIARTAIASIWFYHGLVPKLMVRHVDEFTPLLNSGFSEVQAARMVTLAGWAEIAMAVAMVAFWRWRGGYWVTITLMIAALVGVAVTTPRLLGMAFNPFSLNLAMIALSAIGLIASRDNQPSL